MAIHGCLNVNLVVHGGKWRESDSSWEVKQISLILNLDVTQGLNGLGACVSNIRNAVKFVRSSQARMAKFKSYIELEKITCTKMVCLDV